MNRAIIMKDRRLIEALDYIDDEYIASAALYKMRSYAESTRPLAQTAGQSVKKHWKHYLGFVACILVLALATPLFTYLPEIINSFAAGWGEGTEEVTDENGIPYTYPMFVDDLEEISPEEMLAIEELFYQFNYDNAYDEYYRTYLYNLELGKDISFNEEYAIEQAEFGANRLRHRYFNEMYYGSKRYYGKINDCVILASVGMDTLYWIIDVAGYKFAFPSSSTIYTFLLQDKVMIYFPIRHVK